MQVAIVGAGPAGLVAARHLVSRLDAFDVDVFEQREQIGGTWAYTNETDSDMSTYSVMYKNLRTNSPIVLMQLPDFPFKDPDGPSFVHHSVFYQYLLDYAQHFNLYPHIKIKTLVEYVEPKKLENGRVIWMLRYRDQATKVQTIKPYDVVVLCSGYFSVKYVPKISGIDSFKGISLHSHQFRMPEDYADKNVCIIGGSASGIDISHDISKYAKMIYLSSNRSRPIYDTMPKNVQHRPPIDYVNKSTFFFQGGSSAEIDVLIYCTGYQLKYSFVSSKVDIKTKEYPFEPIYKQIVHIDWPNLFFMGLSKGTFTISILHIQAQYILALIEGRVNLPSPKQMRKEYDEEKSNFPQPEILFKNRHLLTKIQWAYMEELAKIVGVPTGLWPVHKKIADHLIKWLGQHSTNYRNYRYRIIDQENLIISYNTTY